MKALGRLLLVAVLALGGCSALKPDPQREAQADLAFSQVVSGDEDGFLAQISHGIEADSVPTLVAEVGAALPAGDPPLGRTIHWTYSTGTAGEQYVLDREYAYPDHVFAIRTVMVKVDGSWLVHGFHINGATRAELAGNAFSLKGKSPAHYAMLAGLVAAPALVLGTLGVALYRRRWGWALASLISVTAIKMNWTTGAWAFQYLHIGLMGAGLSKSVSAFAPWIVTVGFPMGAVLFWVLQKHRPKMRRPLQQALPESPESTSAAE